MKRFCFYNLRLQLLILIFTAVLPVFILVFHTVLQQRKLSVNEAHEKALQVVRFCPELS
jgi:hypothetical protein